MKKMISMSFAMMFLLSTAAFASAPICKVRTVGGGTYGLTFTFWKTVEASTLEDCQEAAASLVGETEVSDDYGRVEYYRPWKAWYKWQADGTTTKGSSGSSGN